MGKKASLIAALLLTGCSMFQKKEDIVVKVPVPVKCNVSVPEFDRPIVPQVDVWDQVSALMAIVEIDAEEIKSLRVALGYCTQ